MKPLFVITKRSPRPVNSLTTPSSAAARGVAMQESSTAGVAELADGTKPFAGFQTRASVVGGPPLSDVIYPGRLELPFATSDAGSYEFAEEVEAEGSTYIDSGITSGTALKTALMFAPGKFAVATSGHFAEWMLVEKPTPAVSGNVRIRARIIPGYLVP